MISSMTLLTFLAIAGAILAMIPAATLFRNLALYRPASTSTAAARPAVSVLIPARDEEAAIEAAVTAALASRGVDVEVVVMDDHSEDRTADIVRKLATSDPRVRLESAPPLPAGWCGKQHACYALSRAAKHPLLAFIDADVRLAPDGLARAAAFLEQSGADLVSGVPRQVTGTFLEKLLIPLIHFVLLGFLPIGRMRASRNPAYGAGCGQFFLACRQAYDRAGGHPAIRASLHDGVTLPRAFRRAGLATDLFDATSDADCRMYRSNGQTWRGLAKNATEGMASPAAIVPWTILLFGGQILPLALLLEMSAAGHWPMAALVSCGIGVVALFGSRIALAKRFRQSWLSVVLHPLGVLLLLAIQWQALALKLLRRPAAWRGRVYDVGATKTEPA